MTCEDITLAREAGIKNDCDGIWCDADQLIAFAALVRAAEREACAKLCEAVHARHIAEYGDYIGETYAITCAAAIRARGNT